MIRSLIMILGTLTGLIIFTYFINIIKKGK